MIVTDKQYSIDNRLVEKLDLVVERINQNHQAIILIDGGTGLGKSNLTASISYYLAWKMNRSFSVDNVFFDTDEMIKFASSTTKQIIWWDEAILGGLSTDGFNKVQRKLVKLLGIARKKNHIFLFVIPKFFRLKEPLIDDAVCLLHVYSRDGISRGRFVYYNIADLNSLYVNWKKTRFIMYKKRYTFHGSFVEALSKVINEKEYDVKKDKAIMSLNDDSNDDKDNPLRLEINELKRSIGLISKDIPKTQGQMAEKLGISARTLRNWGYLQEKGDINKKIGEGSGISADSIINSVSNEKDFVDGLPNSNEDDVE